MKMFRPKLFEVFKQYSKKQLISDLIAGVIVAIIALPLSIALAIASGVSPERGLYTAIVAGFVIAALGGSRVNISGPTAAFATIVAGIVAQHGMEGLAIAAHHSNLFASLKDPDSPDSEESRRRSDAIIGAINNISLVLNLNIALKDLI